MCVYVCLSLSAVSLCTLTTHRSHLCSWHLVDSIIQYPHKHGVYIFPPPSLFPLLIIQGTGTLLNGVRAAVPQRLLQEQLQQHCQRQQWRGAAGWSWHHHGLPHYWRWQPAGWGCCLPRYGIPNSSSQFFSPFEHPCHQDPGWTNPHCPIRFLEFFSVVLHLEIQNQV